MLTKLLATPGITFCIFQKCAKSKTMTDYCNENNISDCVMIHCSLKSLHINVSAYNVSAYKTLIVFVIKIVKCCRTNHILQNAETAFNRKARLDASYFQESLFLSTHLSSVWNFCYVCLS